MHLIIGLGPIGAGIGERLAEREHPVAGLDLDPARAAAWAQATGCPGFSSFDDVPWADVDTVIVAVRLANQVTATFDAIRDRYSWPLTILVVTTLSVNDAKEILPAAPPEWRVFEAPISGGPRGARDGSMTVFLAGPQPTPEEQAVLDDIAGRVFTSADYGIPALLKLCNNTLGAYNALATATMLQLTAEHGVSAEQFLDVVSVASGQSWMSDNFTEFHDDLLFKDAHLLQSDLGELPTVSVSPTQEHLSAAIAAARALITNR
ncbi:NAD(P)-binding domain-containing protein [Diaminobutyricimonas sp. TR449]|uniref:NAD(P)-binding domain-containing protein n=1 Tax=Diaminobutyricimonas sp. TR449 TaxID=2708076 RepID=UPI00141EBC17|nr:NAD(P)-binding domain-containing protein [Diaminobutyricimonas sp. TR449]